MCLDRGDKIVVLGVVEQCMALGANAPRHYKTPWQAAGASPGRIYEVVVQGESLVKPEARYFQEMWKNKQDVANWQLNHRIAKEEAASINRAKKENRHNYIFEILEPIRDSYRTASPVGRAHLLAYIIRYVTSGSTKI
jgi:hypothetical protein